MLTTQEIFKEYTKCLSSPIYAIETYLQTFDKTQEGFVPFKLFPRQKEIVYAYEDNRFNLISKPRQAGVSTTTAAYLAVKIAFADIDNPESILILANKQDLAQEFLSKIKDFLSQMPRWVWGEDYYGSEKNLNKNIFAQTESKKELKLPNGSRVKAVATSKDALRGFTPTYLIMDEAAFIDNGAIVFGAALTALGTGGRASLISTPNGMDPLYYKTYEQSKAGRNNFNIVEMKWYEDLRYNHRRINGELIPDLRWLRGDEVEIEIEYTFESYEQRIKDGYKPTSTWYEDMCMGMNNDAKMIAQELDVSFIGSGGNVIHDDDINRQINLNVIDPDFFDGGNDETWIWKEPEEGHQYIMGVDVSRGDGEDSSTIVIIDFTTMEEVLEYQGKIPPDVLAQLVEKYGEQYGAYTVVDITGGMGVATVLKLLEFNYKRLHYDDINGKILSSKQKELQARTMKSMKGGTKIPGFQVGSLRVQMVANFEEKVRHNIIKIRSARLCSEMKTFVYKNGRPDHMEGYHDDLIFAMAMALWVMEHSFKKLEKLEKQTKAILGSWVGSGQIQSDVMANAAANFSPFPNNKKREQPKPNFSPLVAKNMQDPTGKYLWLFSGSK